MLLGLLVVVDAYEEDVACIFSQFGRIVLLLYLVDGCFYGMVEFQLATPTSSSLGIAGASSALLSLVRQFNDEGRLVNVATGNHHQVGIALACSVLTMDDILVFAHISPYSIPKIKVLSGTAKRPTTLPAIYFCKGS